MNGPWMVWSPGAESTHEAGNIPEAGLAAAELPVSATFSVCELRLTSKRPDRDFFRTREDLIASQAEYRSFQSELARRHGPVADLEHVLNVA